MLHVASCTSYLYMYQCINRQPGNQRLCVQCCKSGVNIAEESFLWEQSFKIIGSATEGAILSNRLEKVLFV